MWGGVRRGEAAWRVVGLVVGRSGAAAGRRCRAWRRSVWIGLECVDGSLAGAGAAAVGGCDVQGGQLGTRRHGWKPWRHTALKWTGRVYFGVWVLGIVLDGRRVSASQGGLWGEGVMCWGGAWWRRLRICVLDCLSVVTAARLDCDRCSCKQRPRVDCRAAARPRRRRETADHGEHMARSAAAALQRVLSVTATGGLCLCRPLDGGEH